MQHTPKGGIWIVMEFRGNNINVWPRHFPSLDAAIASVDREVASFSKDPDPVRWGKPETNALFGVNHVTVRGTWTHASFRLKLLMPGE